MPKSAPTPRPEPITGATVGDLLKVLRSLPPRAVVVLASDAECNMISPWSGKYEPGHFTATEGSDGMYGEVAGIQDARLDRTATAVLLMPLK